ncbi:4'-phosphopantetheinyl transferase family protein [Nocardia sp. NPDC058518]|uniref:4'-phosphopantetheinyl transferase family protein n=1 Tax=Nocardia sp. NPDC058518 TaxID=3346534 RepID=UPI003655BBE2
MTRGARWTEVGTRWDLGADSRIRLATITDWLPLTTPPETQLRAVLGTAFDRWNAMTCAFARGRMFASRALLRAVVADRLGCDAGEIDIHTEPGRPPQARWGTAPAPVAISLSHTGDTLAVAVADSGAHDDGIGVDIEASDRPIYTPTFVTAVAHPDELAQLADLDPDERNDALVALWTMKESVLKARGTGLTVVPRRICVGLPTRDTASTTRDVAAPDGHRTRIGTTTHHGLRISAAHHWRKHA